MNRQAATSRGLRRRIEDLDFGQVADPRQPRRGMVKLRPMLTAMVASMVTGARSLRGTEQRTEQMGRKGDDWHGLTGRIPDNTIGGVLPRLHLRELEACQHRLIKAEHRRGNLASTRLAVGTVAIDGKNTATLRWHDLCRVLELDESTATVEQVEPLLAERFPAVQLHQPDNGQPYGLVRVHTVTRRVTTDAGNTSLAVMGQIHAIGWSYFGQIKANHGELYREAVRALGMRTEQQAEASYGDAENGLIVEYHLWRHDLSDEGWLDWTHARQLVRVQRVATNPKTGERSVGNRYYVANRRPQELGAQAALSTSRAHWRCENETHWTLDAELRDDRRRLAWSRHPDGIAVVAVLRLIALAILAVARRLSRLGHSREAPTWAQVMDNFLLQIAAPALETDAFDNV